MVRDFQPVWKVDLSVTGIRYCIWNRGSGIRVIIARATVALALYCCMNYYDGRPLNTYGSPPADRYRVITKLVFAGCLSRNRFQIGPNSIGAECSRVKFDSVFAALGGPTYRFCFIYRTDLAVHQIGSLRQNMWKEHRKNGAGGWTPPQEKISIGAQPPRPHDLLHLTRS